MNTSKLIVISIFAYASTNEAYTQKKEKDKLLAGKIFETEFTEQKKKAKPVKDDILFKNEKISVKFIAEKTGFKDNPYTASVDSSSDITGIIGDRKVIHFIHFESESKNKDNEVIKWNGSVTNETIEGTAVITDKKGKTKTEYSFTGNLKSKKK